MSDDDKVRMTHPELPDREIWVRPRGVAVREKSGWVQAVAPSTEEAPAGTPAAPATKKTAAGSGDETKG